MAASERPAGQGRSASDIALLLVLAVVALETKELITAGWLLTDGELGGLNMIVVAAQNHLIMPVIVLLGASVGLSVLAGRRRNFSADFDLACVALVPLVAIEIANRLLFLAGLNAHNVFVVIGYGWYGALMIVAYLQTQQRESRP